ncbi:MAG: CPBP family intramembrane metalloprotease [Erysipelotrichaceae bacterium]|nr:CPBP family intramembrane metalloprotease [Erysipelotrichaceae bacterium]
MNMLIYKIIPLQETPTIALPIAFLSSGLIGPIYEEILFRYLFFNRLKKYFSKKKAILITTLIFALIHLSPIKIIYAFFLGLILTISYEKYQTILAPVLIHIFANSIVLFLNEYNTYILLLSIINLGLNIKQIAPKNRFQS